MKNYYVLAVVLVIMMSTANSQINHTFTFNTVDFPFSTDSEKYTHIEGYNFDGFLSQEGATVLPVMIKKFVLPMGSTVTGIQDLDDIF